MKPDRYDQVAVRMAGGGYNLMTRREFETMPLNKRVRLIMDDQVQFLLAGKTVSAREALAK
jgi:translation elongation factor P/translation initiation factor 5A